VPGRAVAAGGFHGGEGVQGVQAGGDAGELGGVFLGGGDEDVVVAGRVDRTHGAGREPAQGGEGQQAGGLHLEVFNSLRREAGDDVGLARHEAGDLAALGAVEAGGGGGDADVVAVATGVGGGGEGEDGLRVGDGGVALFDEVAGGVLEAQGGGGDRKVAELHVGLEGAGAAAADHDGAIDELTQLDDGDLGRAAAHAGAHDGDAQAAVDAGVGDELAVAALVLDGVEQAGDAGGAGGVADQHDVAGDLFGGQADVILPTLFVADALGGLEAVGHAPFFYWI
jgi:hypothetical protein